MQIYYFFIVENFEIKYFFVFIKYYIFVSENICLTVRGFGSLEMMNILHLIY